MQGPSETVSSPLLPQVPLPAIHSGKLKSEGGEDALCRFRAGLPPHLESSALEVAHPRAAEAMRAE